MTELDPSTVVVPIDSDDTCPGCGATTGVQSQPALPTVQAWTCTACGMNWCTTVVNPTVRAALSIVGLLPTPQQRTAALLAALRSEVTQRSAKGHHPMPDTVCFPVTELVNIDPMASVATAVWWCRLCGDEATAASRPAAHSDAVAHLVDEHHATLGIAPNKLRPAAG